MEKYQGKIEYFLNAAGTSLLLVVTILTTGDVIGRHFLNSPIAGVYESTGLLGSITIFLGLAYTQSMRGHIRMRALKSVMSPKQLRIADLFEHLLNISFLGLLTWLVAIKAGASWAIREYEMGLLTIPLYPFRFLMLVGIFVFFLRCVSDLYDWSQKRPYETPGTGGNEI